MKIIFHRQIFLKLKLSHALVNSNLSKTNLVEAPDGSTKENITTVGNMLLLPSVWDHVESSNFIFQQMVP